MGSLPVPDSTYALQGQKQGSFQGSEGQIQRLEWHISDLVPGAVEDHHLSTAAAKLSQAKTLVDL
jgi:hypothetical protein